MRLIDADALLKEYDRVHAGPPGGARKLIEDAPTVDLPDALRAAGWKEEGWVSVKDRLPEVGKVVLAFGTRSATTGMFQGTMTNRPDVWMWKNHTPKKVTHWMPLPPGPEVIENG